MKKDFISGVFQITTEKGTRILKRKIRILDSILLSTGIDVFISIIIPTHSVKARKYIVLKFDYMNPIIQDIF